MKPFYFKLLSICLFLTANQKAMSQTANSGNNFGYAYHHSTPKGGSLSSSEGETPPNPLSLKSPWKADNLTLFYTYTTEGITMWFSVVSEEEGTCQVGGPVPDMEGYSYLAIDTLTSGTVTIPPTAKGYKVIGINAIAFKKKYQKSRFKLLKLRLKCAIIRKKTIKEDRKL